jgi:Na+/melibiose symporter-like transporter
MLPDVIDEFMIKTGERNESIFYSFYVFFNKLSVGVAVGLSTLVLEYKILNFIFHSYPQLLVNLY